MPLIVLNEDRNAAAANTLFWQGRGLTFPYIGEAGMGGFWTSQNPGHATALATSGAGPCQIIVVHCTNGHGALGHYAAHPNPAMILQGLQDMLNALPGAPVDSILFAAGAVAAQRGQLMYEMQIVAGARQMAPGARVMWPTQDNDDNWGAAMYLPLTGEVGLFHLFPASLIGRTGAGNGLTPYGY